ncbi:putative penicillin-binding protein [Candidatus Sulfotelmatomonas gaucii]|uniref:Putative penicillin-binding protein n=1 Tax=Candidatus Sulfuritelmatomonas gaucii TaxID=2043161 RepID=A0A2N9LQV7_9BACT|nr:putative penicillin-binding protein [Candidatus Sulfotelmatomonas gaucii]
MRLSRVRAIAFFLFVFGVFCAGAAALNVPQSTTVHHSKSKTASHVSSARHAVVHHSAATTSARASSAHTSSRSTHSSRTHVASTRSTTSHIGSAHLMAGAAVVSGTATTRTAYLRRTSLHRRHRYYERFTASSFVVGGVGEGDITAGEDPVVRQAAIDALGDMNGTAVVINPSNGRILAMVNQKLALSPGAEPCSTIKLTVALAALSEGLVTRDTMVQLPGFRMNMTQALAKSNNLYFEELGRELGFDRVRHYATEFGLGELAGYEISGEQLGEYPDQPIPESEGGVARMCSFGQGVSLTPLQLGALVAAIANGGTLYYLQHPTTPEEIANFRPKVKRVLNIAKYVPDLEDGMAGAVEYGTARSLRVNFRDLPVFGKTGTCSDNGTRFGWFASYSNSAEGSLVTVFFLEGGRPTFGPKAAELTGDFYRDLWDHDFFQVKNQDAGNSATPAPAAGAEQ